MTNPWDFYFRFFTLSLKEFMASLIVLMHLVTFFLENDSVGLIDFLFDRAGMFSFS